MDRMEDRDRAALYEQMLGVDGSEMVVETFRGGAEVARDGQHTHISAVAMGNVMDQLNCWITSRMTRHWERSGRRRGVHNLRVTINVETTGALEPGGEPVAEQVRLVAIDGRWQVEALR